MLTLRMLWPEWTRDTADKRMSSSTRVHCLCVWVCVCSVCRSFVVAVAVLRIIRTIILAAHLSLKVSISHALCVWSQHHSLLLLPKITVTIFACFGSMAQWFTNDVIFLLRNIWQMHTLINLSSVLKTIALVSFWICNAFHVMVCLGLHLNYPNTIVGCDVSMREVRVFMFLNHWSLTGQASRPTRTLETKTECVTVLPLCLSRLSVD